MTTLALGAVTPQTEACAEALAVQFPAIPLIGGYRPGTWGYHRTGQALDVMVYSNRALGDAVAAWSITNHAIYGIAEIIWWQRFFNPLMPSKGWRTMNNRGGITANHMDHVHLSTFGVASGGTPIEGPPMGSGGVPRIRQGWWAEQQPVQTIVGEDDVDPRVRFGGRGRFLHS